MLIGFLAVLAFLLPLAAQDAKKDAKKETEKKVVPDKKDEKKDDKKEEKKKEKLVYGAKFITKIVGIKGDSNREFSIQVQEVDPKRVYDNNVWSVTRQQQLQQQYAQQVLQQKDFNARAQALQRYNMDVANYRIELAKRATQIYVTKNVEVRAADNARVRTNVLPVEFDDQGFQKKWTKKEIEERKDKTGLPGYFASEFDAVKQGQAIEIYMAKLAAPAPKAKKKGPADDDPGAPMVKDRAEFVLIVILAEQK